MLSPFARVQCAQQDKEQDNGTDSHRAEERPRERSLLRRNLSSRRIRAAVRDHRAALQNGCRRGERHHGHYPDPRQQPAEGWVGWFVTSICRQRLASPLPLAGGRRAWQRNCAPERGGWGGAYRSTSAPAGRPHPQPPPHAGEPRHRGGVRSPAVADLDLTCQSDLAPVLCRLKNGEANLERGETPFAGMERRPIANHRVVKFVDDLRTRDFW